MNTLGLYISVPFCKAKCTFCNFASDAFAPARMDRYLDRLCHEIAAARTTTSGLDARLPNAVDTVYLGGGTPSLLQPQHIRQLFASIHTHFAVAPDAEITLECAPGQLTPETLNAFQREGVNRVSLGVQSFVDLESKAIGRLHTEKMCLDAISHLRTAGIENINLDLIAGLPHQTEATCLYSLNTAIATNVPHLSVYMLEVDEDSRLGRELLNSGPRYGAATVPSDDDSANFYQQACDRLNTANIPQYEISNFARPGHQSRHNLKYWRRHPYLGLGLDAHSMLQTSTGQIRFANTDNLDVYEGLADRSGMLSLVEGPAITFASPAETAAFPAPEVDHITLAQAFEETLFLGLRLNQGISLTDLRNQFGPDLLDQIKPALEELRTTNLITLTSDGLALTDRGRMVSNEVFGRLLLPEPALA